MLHKVSEAPGRQDVKALVQSTVLNERLKRYLPDLQKGTNINTLLLRAARAGHSDVAAVLIEKGANIEAKDDTFGETALMTAAHEGNADTVRLLLDKGANTEAKDNHGTTALGWAAGDGNAEVVKLLLGKGANIGAKDEYGNTALGRAASSDQVDVVKLLLDNGANTEAKDAALMSAASYGRADMVKLLLDNGANIEAKGNAYLNEGETALVTAAREGRTEVVKLLLDKGANTEAKGSRGYTALLLAADQGNVEVVKLLLEKGANIEAKGSESPYEGETALSMATRRQKEWSDFVGKVNWVNNQPPPLGPIGAGIDHNKDAKHLSNFNEVAQLLRQAVSRDPRTNFTEYVNGLQSSPHDEARREKVIKLAVGLPTPPAIPEEARQLFLQASALIKQTSSPKELEQPIELLRKALVIAPWWGNAYYNLSRAGTERAVRRCGEAA